MTKPPPKISAAESQVMEVLWDRSPLAAEDIAAQLSPKQDWSDGTVKTLVRRLLTKGAVKAEPDGRRYLYSPILQRTDYLAAESRSLIDRLFGGQVSALVNHFSEREDLTDEDLAELKRIVREIEDGR